MRRKIVPIKGDVFYWLDKFVTTLDRVPNCPHTLIEMFWHWNKKRRRALL